MRRSNKLIGLLNFFTLVLSVPILGGGIWLSTRSNGTECLKFLQLPLIIIAVIMMVTALAGLIGACYRNTLLMALYLLAMIFIMLVFLGFIIFAYAATAKGSGKVTENRAYLEYYLQDYQGWLKERVASDEYWTKISSCVRESKLCGKLGRTIHGVPENADTFYLRNLSPIQVSSSSSSSSSFFFLPVNSFFFVSLCSTELFEKYYFYVIRLISVRKKFIYLYDNYFLYLHII